MGVKKYLDAQNARKANGETPRTYPHHAGKARVVKTGAPASVVKTALPCLDATPLTAAERRARGLDDRSWKRCENESLPLGSEIVCSCQGCGPGCKGYVSTESPVAPPIEHLAAAPLPAPVQRSGPRVGVAIGSYHWPELIDLQCRVIRDTCGPVPILVSADDPATYARLGEVCADHPDVILITNNPPIGHTGGDIAVFHRGAKWGADRGLEVVCKLSQRFIATRQNWLQDGAQELLTSTRATSTRKCTGIARYPIRSEAVLMDVAQWSDPEVLKRTEPRQYWRDTPKGIAAEVLLFRVMEDLLGHGYFWPWKLLTEERFAPADGYVWHNGNTVGDYHQLAARYGVALPDDFHVDGWQGELRKGLYRHG